MPWQLSRYAPCVGRLKRWSVISLLIPKFGSYCNGTWLVTLPEKLSPPCAAVPLDITPRKPEPRGLRLDCCRNISISLIIPQRGERKAHTCEIACLRQL